MAMIHDVPNLVNNGASSDILLWKAGKLGGDQVGVIGVCSCLGLRASRGSEDRQLWCAAEVEFLHSLRSPCSQPLRKDSWVWSPFSVR